MIIPKSRFNFNIGFLKILKELVLNIFIKDVDKKKYDIELKYKLKNFFPNSNFIFFSHGRTSFYYLLKNLRKQTKKKKIIINSFTLFEMINIIIYAGFEPILIDQKNNSFESNFESAIKENINDIAAITVTHFNGFNEDIFKVKKLISEINDEIIIIEDTAVGFGSKNDKKFSGDFADYSILSFNIYFIIFSYSYITIYCYCF